MAHHQYRGVVDRVETIKAPSKRSHHSYDLFVLRNVVRLDGTPTMPEQRVGITDVMRRLGIGRGNLIAFSAQVDAYTADGKWIVSDIEGEGELPPGAICRLAKPSHIELVAYRALGE